MHTTLHIQLTETKWRIYTMPSLIQITACRLLETNPLSEPNMACWLLDPQEQSLVKFE